MAEYVATSSAYTSRVFGLTTGLAGIVRFRLIDNDTTADDPLYGPSAAGIIEDPAGSGSYLFDSATVGQVAPATAGKFSRIWDSGAATELVPDEDMITQETLTAVDLVPGDSYATVDELFRILKIRTPSADQTDAAERVLIAAAGEINSEIDLEEDSALSGWELHLAAQVNLERAAELWKLQEVQFGIVLGSEFGATHIARNTWDKHAFTLAPLKEQWGLA